MLNKILKVIGRRQSKKTAGLLMLMLISMVLETVGIGLVLPFIDIVDNGSSSMVMELKYISEWSAGMSHRELIFVSLIFLVVFFLFKNGFLAFMSWYRADFLNSVHGYVSKRLFKGFLNMPYVLHLQTNTANFIRSVRDESAHLIGGLDHFIEILTQTFVLLGVVFFLIWIEPIGGMVVFTTLGSAGFVFHRITKRKLGVWGRENLRREGLRLKHLQQGFHGIKDVKIFRKEKKFLDKFHKDNTLFLMTNMKHKFVSSLPRLWFEFLAIFGIAILVLSVLLQDRAIESLVSILAVYAAAAFRIMPNLNNILVGLQGIQFAKENINSVHKALLNMEKHLPPKMKFEICFNQTIKFKNVSYRYNSDKKAVLNNINLEIQKGEMVGIIGPSGSGKSTFVDVLIGLLKVDSGGVFVDGVDINLGVRSWMKNIGYVPQNIYLIDGSIQDNVAFGLSQEKIDENSLYEALDIANLTEFVASLPDGVYTRVGENGENLSGGQKQRIGIARALYHNPSLLILDEATSALDEKTEASIMKSLSEINKTKTIILITHKPHILGNCSQVYKVENGFLIKYRK